jgi:sirohydrochlorin ferrochelatase
VRAVLLVDHGSRRPEANAVLDGIAELLRDRLPGTIVRVAHMELAAPGIGAGVDACVAEGATEIVVHPYFLGPGEHASQDIPSQVRAAGDRHRHVSIRVSEPLGVHPGLVDAILDRIGRA